MAALRVEQLETPVLTIDLDRVERNIASLQAYCDEHGIALRPHTKTHKLPQVARMQVDAGAVGITCQKLGEAEVMADAGFGDIMVTYPLVGRHKAERLAALASRATMSVVGDSAIVAEGLSEVLAERGVTVGFLVECDTGLGRTGVQTPAEAAELAERVSGPARPALRRADDVPVASARAGHGSRRHARRPSSAGSRSRASRVAALRARGTPTSSA